jgi:PilZ domain
VLFLSNDSVLEEPFGGLLMDASQGGVRLATRLVDVREGTLLLVRPPAAPKGTAWVPVTVTNRRQASNRWEVGCRFARALSRKTLQLFAS